MSAIGIIANPSSGSDIRRLVSFATAYDNSEKLNIVKRIILGAQAMGIDKIYIMQDSYHFGRKAIEALTRRKMLSCKCELLDNLILGDIRDTFKATELLEEHGVGAIVVLGGDGTSRAVAKIVNDIPILPISTGTNNVYPLMIEGTVAGMAAAITAISDDISQFCVKDKRIEVLENGEIIDIALVDAVISSDKSQGARAIYDYSKISHIYVTRAHPAYIGFSSIVGTHKIIYPEDPYGYMVGLGEGGSRIKSPVSAGVIEDFYIKEEKMMDYKQINYHEIKERCAIALDGEKELLVNPGRILGFRITHGGPSRILPKETLKIAQINGYFRKLP